MSGSLRGRLTGWLLLATVPLVVVCGAGLYLLVRSSLTARFDDGMIARAAGLVAATTVDGGWLEFGALSEAPPQYRTGGDEYFLIRRVRGAAPGETLQRSESLGGKDLSVTVPGEAASLEPRLADASLPDGRIGRVLVQRFRPYPEPDADGDHAEYAGQAAVAADEELLLVVARPRADLDRTLSLLRLALTGTGVVLVAAISGAVLLALRRGLRPVADLSRQVGMIDPSRPGKRIDAPGAPRELLPVVDRLNDLLVRMEDALEREKKTTASMAHELRTPVAEIKAVSELALSRPRTGPEYQRALQDVLEIVARMEGSVGALLRLARVNAGLESALQRPIDLMEVLRPRWAGIAARAADRHIKADLIAPESAGVQADPDMLTVIVENLLANAAQYTPEGGRIRCEVNLPDDRTVEMVLDNATAAVPSAQLNGSPGAAAGDLCGSGAAHLGIGLALCAGLAGASGARFEAGRVAADRFSARLRLQKGIC